MSFEDDNLVRSLYSGAFKAPYWEGFLEHLLARTQAAATTLLIQSAENDAGGVFVAGAPMPSKMVRRLQSAPDTLFRDNRIYTGEELQDLAIAEVGKAKPRMPLARAVRVRIEDGVQAWLIAEGGAQIGAPTGALLSSLAGHLQVALRSFVALEAERYRAEIASQTIERLRLGWLTLDARCTILDASENIDQFLEIGGVLSRGRYDRLIPISRDIDRELSQTVRAYAQGNSTKPQAFTLSVDPWFNMLVTPAPKQRIGGADRAAALVYVSGDRRSEADRCDQLVELFGLLPSEARLAWLLAQAVSITEAADSLGLTVETARNYSKKIYAKTGARGQSELVRIVMTSVLALN